MTATELYTALGYTPLNRVDTQEEITGCYTSDLLSDVIGNAEESSAFITIQAHKNSVAVASLAGMPLIILCSNRTPIDDMIAKATEEEIQIVSTKDNQFTASWKVAKALGIA